jgi:DNA repair exonuclease SbcCD ATPase subunit
MVTYLKNDIKNFVGILQVADIHLRLTKRHDEYLLAFDKLYSAIKLTPPETVVAVLGDVFHSKSDLSPECVEFASEFLKAIADLRPTILVAGNHDATLSNRNRLDSLTPIVNALDHKNLYYLRDTGLYTLGDILFNNMSIFSPPEDYIKAKDIPKIYRNNTNYLIGLFHGPVNNAITDIGYVVSNRSITLNTFDGHEIVLLGDIHKYQLLQRYNSNNDKPVVVYPGSFVQQNHGEDVSGHGYVVWNLKTKAFRHFEIPNEYGFYTIEVNKGKLVTDIKDIPKKARLRIKCFESVIMEVKSVLAAIKEHTDISEVTYFRVDDGSSLKNIINTANLKLSDIGSVDYQNELIKAFLTKKFPDKKITDEEFNKVFEINKQLNALIEKDNLVRNIRWRPKKFEFNNMFSYGEGNVIDFTNMKNTIGLFAQNTAGKSSILSALSFCIFDKCDRAFKASHVLNSQKMSFDCKFNFEINGVDFFIERKGIADKKGIVKVDVKFWKEENGKITELNGEARRSTNDIIRDYLGTYDDFILTALSIQNNKAGSFVDMGQTERKDLLSQFMGLTIFDSLYQESVDKLKEINGELKSYNLLETDIYETIRILSEKIEKTDVLYKKESGLYESLQADKTLLNDKIIEQNKKLIKLEIDVPKDVNDLISKKNVVGAKISKYDYEIKELKSDNESSQNDLNSVLLKIKTSVDSNIDKRHEEFETLNEELNQKNNELETRKIVIKSKLDKINKLEKHKYDPNCKFCVDNEFVKDAILARDTIGQDKKEVDDFIKEYDALSSKIKSTSGILDEYTTYENDLELKNRLENSVKDTCNSILKLENLMSGESKKLSEIEQNIILYHQQKDAIENNNAIEKIITSIDDEIDELDKKIKNKNKEVISINSELVSIKKDKELQEKNVQKIKELEAKKSAYEHYVFAVSRDGIPFELISQAIPVIEREVNEILSQIVEFTVNIQTDGKNVITYICYPDKKWALELSSGMERFISSIAIRTALINISNLPRPNFLVVDEGFSALDASNLPALSTLFSVLKTQFDFLIIISHLDAIRDFVDSRMEITKENGFSKIVY